MPARSLKEQFSRGSEAWKGQSDPIFRFWTEGDWWGFPFFSLSASRYLADKEKALDLYAGFCAHRATCLIADGKDITELKLILNDDSNAQKEADPL